MSAQDLTKLWDKQGYPVTPESRPLFHNLNEILPDGPTPEQQACLDLYETIRQHVQAPIFTQENPGLARAWFGTRLKTAGYLFNDREAIIVSITDRIPTRTLFHELSHLKLRWVDRFPQLTLPDPRRNKPVEKLLNNELDHLEFLPREFEIFGPRAREKWTKEYSQFPSTRGPIDKALAFPLVAIRSLLAQHVLLPPHRKKINQTARRLELQSEVDAFVKGMTKLSPNRSDMIKFALDQFQISRSGAKIRTESPDTGKPLIQTIV